MATKNNPGNFDCYEKAEPDEPMFVLLARDKHAPTLIWLWCAMREMDEESPEKLVEARQCMLDMISWANSRGRPLIGLSQAVLTGVMELARAANATSASLDAEGALRAILSRTRLEAASESPADIEEPSQES